MPGKARKDTYRVLRERDEEGLPAFRRLNGLESAFENTPVPRRWAISPRRISVSIFRQVMGGKKGASPKARVLSRSSFFNRLSRIDNRDHSLNGAFLIGCRRCPSLEAAVPCLLGVHGPSDPAVPKSLADLRPSAVFRKNLSASGGTP